MLAVVSLLSVTVQPVVVLMLFYSERPAYRACMSDQVRLRPAVQGLSIYIPQKPEELVRWLWLHIRTMSHIWLTIWENEPSCFPEAPQNQTVWRRGKQGSPTHPERERFENITSTDTFNMNNTEIKRLFFFSMCCMYHEFQCSCWTEMFAKIVNQCLQNTLHGCGSTPYVSSIWAFWRKFRSDVSGVCPLRESNNTQNSCQSTMSRNNATHTFLKRETKTNEYNCLENYWMLTSVCQVKLKWAFREALFIWERRRETTSGQQRLMMFVILLLQHQNGFYLYCVSLYIISSSFTWH